MAKKQGAAAKAANTAKKNVKALRSIERKHSGWWLVLFFIIVVGVIMICALALGYLFIYLFQKTGNSLFDLNTRGVWIFMVIAVLVGVGLAAIVSRIPMLPIRRIIRATNQLANGDFSARINIRGARELNNLSDSFNRMAEQLGSVEVLQNDFMNNFAHEFKTPIVSISGFAKQLKRDDLTDEERNEYLDIIISESNRLSDLAMNVLELSKVESQTELRDVTELNVTEQIRQEVALLANRWMDKNIEVDLEGEDVTVTGDKELLSQVWINLLDNAIKFSPEHSVIPITVRRAEDAVVVTITNDGEPLSEDAQAHLFDRFYQVDPSHAQSGSGLGLAIAQKIVTLHGGTITVTSSADTGTTFTVTL